MSVLFSSLASANGPASSVLFWVGQALVFGTALALITWLLTSVALRRMRPALHAAFWVIVLVKFIVPIGPEFSYSLSSLVAAYSPVSLSPNPALPEQKASAAMPVGGEWIFYTFPVVGEAKPSKAAPAALPISSLIAFAYVTGLVIVTALRMLAYVRFTRWCRGIEPASVQTAARVASIARAAGVSRALRVRICDTASAPFIFGALRPTLVLARRHLDRPSEFEAVVLHEIAHLRRGDLLVRYLQWFAGTVLYFWPVVAWVNRRIDLAREHACDEWALRRGPLSPAQYARCLLSCVQRTRPRLSAYAPASMAARPTHVQRRIEMILNSTESPRAGRWARLLAGATLVGWTGFALSGASAAAIKSDPKKDVSQLPQTSQLGQAEEAVAESVEPALLEVRGQPIQFQLQFVTADGQSVSNSGEQVLIIRSMVLAGPDDQPIQVFGFHTDGETPEMDADGNGDVTPDEHDAYVVAKAMSNPEAVLAQYPDADSDHDGALSADEAAELIGGPFEAPLPPPPPPGEGAFTLAPQISAEGNVNIVFEAVSEDGAPALNLIAKRIEIQPQSEGASEAETTVTATNQHEVTATESHEAVAMPAQQVGVPFLRDLPIIGNFFRPDDQTVTATETTVVGCAAEPTEAAEATGQAFFVTTTATESPTLPPAAWIMGNIDAKPSAKDVASQVDRTLAASLRRFLKMHPKSDRNRDGVLTVAERDAFIDKTQSSTRERYLKAHPEADTDGDGILTPREMSAAQKERRTHTRRIESDAVEAGAAREVEGTPEVQIEFATEADGPK